MQLYLTGFMGAGKTTVGRCLAEKLRRPFVDLDREVEHRRGLSIREIFDHHGEEGFRRLEHEVLEDLAAGEPRVIATGGGVVLSLQNRRLMNASGRTIWLNAPFPLILERLGFEGRRRRPLFQDEAEARELYQARLPLYRQCDLEIEVGGDQSPDELAREIIRRLRTDPCDI